MSLWLVWFDYYYQRVDVGIVEAETPEDACQKFWTAHGDGGAQPARGVHALPAVPGYAIGIDLEGL